ncbi:MAG TPA: hypothetical protein VHA14_14260 [Bryobacteraceae bacterium]|nr:hypothetical protein [Bryobacteraceae bacterium]
MTSLPVIRGVSAANYPVDVSYTFLTGVGEWQNGAQQRWPRQPGCRVNFSIPYAGLSQSQKNTIRTAVSSAKGRFATDLSISFLGTTYTNMSIDADQWWATENKPTVYAAPIRIVQTIAQNLSPGTPGLAFPTLANGAMCLVPYSEGKRFQTVATSIEAGPLYTTAEFGGGFTGYPTDGLGNWRLPEEMLSDADTAAIVAHFIANWGKLYSFSFTDEAGTAFVKSHYASDVLTVRYRGVNDSTVQVLLEATN